MRFIKSQSARKLKLRGRDLCRPAFALATPSKALMDLSFLVRDQDRRLKSSLARPQHSPGQKFLVTFPEEFCFLQLCTGKGGMSSAPSSEFEGETKNLGTRLGSRSLTTD